MNLEESHPRRPWRVWWQDHGRRTDMVIALIVAVIGVVGTYTIALSQPDRRALDLIAIALLVAGAAALGLRRSYPGAVLIFIKAITLLYLVLNYPKGPNFIPIIIAVFTAVMQERRLIAWMVLAGEFILFPWVPYFLGNQPAPSFMELVGGLIYGVLVVTHLSEPAAATVQGATIRRL